MQGPFTGPELALEGVHRGSGTKPADSIAASDNIEGFIISRPFTGTSGCSVLPGTRPGLPALGELIIHVVARQNYHKRGPLFLLRQAA
jgi:hypothetical protein